MADTPDQAKPTSVSQDAPGKDAPQKPKGPKRPGMTRKGFGLLLKRAFTPDVAKSDPNRK
jgi:hypothetical protein